MEYSKKVFDDLKDQEHLLLAATSQGQACSQSIMRCCECAYQHCCPALRVANPQPNSVPYVPLYPQYVPYVPYVPYWSIFPMVFSY